jgi:hypothetical protein
MRGFATSKENIFAELTIQKTQRTRARKEPKQKRTKKQPP